MNLDKSFLLAVVGGYLAWARERHNTGEGERAEEARQIGELLHQCGYLDISDDCHPKLTAKGWALFSEARPT